LTPEGEAGTINVTPDGMFPDESVVTVAGLVVITFPSYFTVTIDDGAKPEPDIVTVLPTSPDGEESEIDEEACASSLENNKKKTEMANTESSITRIRYQLMTSMNYDI